MPGVEGFLKRLEQLSAAGTMQEAGPAVGTSVPYQKQPSPRACPRQTQITLNEILRTLSIGGTYRGYRSKNCPNLTHVMNSFFQEQWI